MQDNLILQFSLDDLIEQLVASGTPTANEDVRSLSMPLLRRVGSVIDSMWFDFRRTLGKLVGFFGGSMCPRVCVYMFSYHASIGFTRCQPLHDIVEGQ